MQLIKKFPAFYGTPKFITVLTSARHLSLSYWFMIPPLETPPPRRSEWGSILPPYCFVSRGSISPMGISEHFVFHGEQLLAPRPTPKLEYHPLSAVRDCLFNLFAATLHFGGRFSIRNLRTRHAVVTGTHKHGRYIYVGMYTIHYCTKCHVSLTTGPISYYNKTIKDFFFSEDIPLCLLN